MKVYEGERGQADRNRLLGQLDVEVRCDAPSLNVGPDAFRVQKRPAQDRGRRYHLLGLPIRGLPSGAAFTFVDAFF